VQTQPRTLQTAMPSFTGWWVNYPTERVLRFLEYGPECNTLDRRGKWPLHKALVRFSEYPKVIEGLLRAGADPNMKNYNGLTPSSASIIWNSFIGGWGCSSGSGCIWQRRGPRWEEPCCSAFCGSADYVWHDEKLLGMLGGLSTAEASMVSSGLPRPDDSP